MKQTTRDILVPALVLVGFSVVGAILLTGSRDLTHTAIEAAERDTRNALLAQVFPQGNYDNDLARSEASLPPNPLLGLKRPGVRYVATREGRPVGAIFEAVAPDGYAGEIRLLIGVFADGRIAGVRVVQHQETPGLGDYIEAKRGPWVRQFDGKSLANPDARGWQVKKDGGQFGYAAGATITPRAIVKAVHRALDYFAQNRATLLTPPGQAKP